MRLIRAASTAVLVSLALVGCGGTDVSSNPLSTANETAPTATISGTPATSTTVGTYYSFTPTASDSDGGKLTYSVTNAPAWASFNTATGQLSGTPKSTDTGTTFNVVISVADGAAHASLPATDSAGPSVRSIPFASPAPCNGHANLSAILAGSQSAARLPRITARPLISPADPCALILHASAATKP